MVEGVTFDFWDTIVVDDSDEAIRKERGLPSKAEARRALFVDEVLAHHDIDRSLVDQAFDHANTWFRHAWKVEHRTPSVADRLGRGLLQLGIGPTPGFGEMVTRYERMEVELPPRLAPGIGEALDALSGKYRIGIISDAIVTPGTGLRDILDEYGLLHHFQHFVFSDEAGASKPDRKVFDLAAEGLGVPVTALAHVGDREYNDIGGPNAVGAKSVLYTGAIDRGSDNTAASVVCTDLRDLPGLLAQL